jgi:hypothetical protein
MASDTADLQRDLGGAIMQSILGALLTAGYATAFATSVASAPDRSKITGSVQSQLEKSFAGAQQVAQRYPQYASKITAAAKSAFLAGDQWAYLAAIIGCCSARRSCSSCSRGTRPRLRCWAAIRPRTAGQTLRPVLVRTVLVGPVLVRTVLVRTGPRSCPASRQPAGKSPASGSPMTG